MRWIGTAAGVAVILFVVWRIGGRLPPQPVPPRPEPGRPQGAPSRFEAVVNGCAAALGVYLVIGFVALLAIAIIVAIFRAAFG